MFRVLMFILDYVLPPQKSRKSAKALVNSKKVALTLLYILAQYEYL